MPFFTCKGFGQFHLLAKQELMQKFIPSGSLFSIMAPKCSVMPLNLAVFSWVKSHGHPLLCVKWRSIFISFGRQGNPRLRVVKRFA